MWFAGYKYRLQNIEISRQYSFYCKITCKDIAINIGFWLIWHSLGHCVWAVSCGTLDLIDYPHFVAKLQQISLQSHFLPGMDKIELSVYPCVLWEVGKYKPLLPLI